MKRFITIFIILTFCGCNNYSEKAIHLNTEIFELIVPEKHEEILILFSGFGGTSKSIKTECNIVQKALQENISILILKNNQNFHFENKQLEKTGNIVLNLIIENNLNSKKIYLGGFSSGGNLGLQLGKHLTKMKDYEESIIGIFVIDSPVDLAQLYFNFQKKLVDDKSGESKYFLELLTEQLGNPEKNIEKYKKYSPFLGSIEYTKNVEFKNTELIFYTEPAAVFRKNNWNQEFENTNGYQIKKLNKLLNKRGYKSKYIETNNKGYRKNGMRNPHSWSILDENEIIEWIKK